MGFVNTFLLMFFMINFCNNITFTCSRKFENHEESRSFIGFGTHTASERPCACDTTTMCSCCQVVKILYTLMPKRLCFNMIYQANVLNVDLSLDTLIMNSITVASYKPFQMCAKIPGVLFSNACVSIVEIKAFPGPAVTVCPRMELSTKKEKWIIPYICSTLISNGTAGAGMVVLVQRPGMPGVQTPMRPMMPIMMPGAPAPGALGAAAGQAPPIIGGPPMSSAVGTVGGARPPAPPMGPMPPGTVGGPMPPVPPMGAMPPGAAMGAMPPGPAVGARPPPASSASAAASATASAAASTIVPRVTGAAGSPVFLVMTNQNLASALESAMKEASASMAMAQENYGLAPQSRFDSGIITGDSQTDLPNDDEQSLLTVTNGDDQTANLSSDPKRYEQNLKVESTTETKEVKNLKRIKRNYDIFDILHQSNRCERAYRICITRSKHYFVSRIRNTKRNIQIKNDDCDEKLVKIVHEPDGNLCTELNWHDNTTPSQVTNSPLESHDSVTYTDDTLSAIVIHDEYSEGSDFHPQNSQYPIPLLTYTKGEMYPSRIPPIFFKEEPSSSNDSILQENFKNLNNDKSIILAVKK